MYTQMTSCATVPTVNARTLIPTVVALATVKPIPPVQSVSQDTMLTKTHQLPVKNVLLESFPRTYDCVLVYYMWSEYIMLLSINKSVIARSVRAYNYID